MAQIELGYGLDFLLPLSLIDCLIHHLQNLRHFLHVTLDNFLITFPGSNVPCISAPGCPLQSGLMKGHPPLRPHPAAAAGAEQRPRPLREKLVQHP